MLRTNVVEPELNVPDIVREYVPAAVPGFVTLVPPPVLQAANVIPIQSVRTSKDSAAAECFFCLPCLIRSASCANVNKNKTRTNGLSRNCGRVAGEPRKTIAGAVVVTVTVRDEADDPFNVREPGETLHVEREGAPEQLKDTT